MNLVPAGTETPSLAGRAASVLFCAEQGFAGAFSDRVLDEVLEGLKPEHLAGRSLLIVGTRGAAIAEQRGLAAAWSAAMANQIANVPELANRLADVLYGRIATEGISDVEVVFSAVDDEHKLTVRRRKLLPISLERFKRPMPALPPLTNLAPAQLLPKLVEEFVYAALCEAAVQSFAAENAARLQAMSAAGDNVDRMLGELFQREREVRQEEITAEIVELAAEVEAAS
jgi:F-type H+-transporting ATPase subunit gamma